MECFLCGNTSDKLPLFKVPIEFVWEDVHFEMIGNAVSDEFICWPCLGYQYDLAKMDKKHVS